MPAKYNIPTRPVPPRIPPVGRLGIVDWREDCSACHNCVKERCVYGFFRDEADTLREEIGYLDYVYQCKGCLSCVQNCTKGILTRVINPEYELLGDEYFTPEIILVTWYQAETGRIPVSGSGYGGPFSGPGFDSMWTDMSEIVRPTRDGIHGREYINTSVDIGRRLPHLSFENGELSVSPPPLIENPLPVIFDIIPGHWDRGLMVQSIVKAASEIGTMVVLRDLERIDSSVGEQCVIPLVDNTEIDEIPANAPMVMLPDREDVAAVRDALKKRNEDQIVAIRLKTTPEAAGRVIKLVREGAEVIHLVFDRHGREGGTSNPRHARDVLREVHGALTEEGIRDQVTLIASGGIALAEHMTKAIICGANLVAVDIPLLLALECRLCGECERGETCPNDIEDFELDYGVQRIVNLMSAWRNQLLEMLGAMGIREVRRLRGETGRCMFFEDLERDTFGRLFGERKEQVGAR